MIRNNYHHTADERPFKNLGLQQLQVRSAEAKKERNDYVLS